MAFGGSKIRSRNLKDKRSSCTFLFYFMRGVIETVVWCSYGDMDLDPTILLVR